ncbi:Heart- and neural crest derivatives-expressed protein 2 [Fukomys damarensis]|uniref:Heart- and neural crest derivatives-expressed protein 2 n=1 Tax=Fukomys damarensis TaxID=885580 RepID=A0A091DFC5_FUKDA|nr:Heart- and neural crest derivatives-expressed protein 2 [Fukomys damarensis]
MHIWENNKIIFPAAHQPQSTTWNQIVKVREVVNPGPKESRDPFLKEHTTTEKVTTIKFLLSSEYTVLQRRGTANRKERRRTQSINSAFAELRECIPNVPADTKLSKIKTLRLATSYIAYLMDLLAKDDQNGEAEAFKAEIKKTDVKEEKRKKELNEILKSTVSSNDKKTKGRTGWPQHVWALELKQ